MKWRKPKNQSAINAQYAEVSDDARYSVCQIGTKFEAWRTRVHDEGPHLVMTNIDTRAAARAACEADDGDTPQPAQPRVKETRKKSNAWSDVHGG